MKLSDFREWLDRLLTKPERLVLALTLLVVVIAGVITLRPEEAIRLEERPAPAESMPTRAEAAQLIDLNTADLENLQTLPGVGPTLAQRIVDYRGEHGGFSSPEELLQVEGIGEKTYAALADRITAGGKEDTHEDPGR